MRVEPAGPGRALYRPRAVFYPHGLSGHQYWWAVAPFHAIVLGGMARNLAQRAVDNATPPKEAGLLTDPQSAEDSVARGYGHTPGT